MHPDRYGRPDTPAEPEYEQRRWLPSGDAGAVPSPNGFLKSLLGLAILALAPIIGLFVTLPLYQWTRPENLTPAWILAYAGTFAVATFAGAVLVYALRRVLLIFALATLTLGIGHTAWRLWIA